jgi:hypothetical protein
LRDDNASVNTPAMTTLQLAPPLSRAARPQPRAAASPGPSPTVEDLIAAAAEHPCGEPELLCLLVLAECLGALAELHARDGRCGGLTPRSLALTGASPMQLLRGCPRDPRLRLVAAEAEGSGAPERRARPGGETTAERGRAAEPFSRPAASWCPPEQVRGGPPVAASDVWGAAAVARALLRALRRRPSPALDSLLAALQSETPERRPTAGTAAARARRLALLALAAWDARRGAEQVPDDVLRYAAGAQQQSSEWGETVASGEARPGSRRVEWRTGPGDRGPGDSCRAVAGRSNRRGTGPPWNQRRAIWVALGPSLAAGLLSLLLAAILLLGG